MYKDLRFVGLIMLALFPILTYGIISICTSLFLVLILISFFKEKEKNTIIKSDILRFLKHTLFYFILIGSLIYSSNLEEGIKFITRTIPLVLFPLFLFFFSKEYKLTERKRNTVLTVFIVSAFLLLIYVYYLAYISIENFHSHSIRDKLIGTEFLDLHSTYISLYFSSTIFILAFFNPLKGNLNKKIILVFLFIGGLLLISSRAVIFFTLLQAIMCLFLLMKMPSFHKLLLFVSSGLIILTLFYKVPFLKNRVTEVFKYGLESTKNDKKLSSTAMRLAVYNCFFELAKEKPLIGYGVGDLQDELNKCYETLNSPTFSKQKLNTHNFYFLLMGSGGFFSLLFFIFLILDLLMDSWRNKSWMLFNIFLLLFLTLLTENILVRSYGITYYCFFLSLFYFSNNKYNFKKTEEL